MRPGKIQKLHVKRKRGVFKCDQCPSVFGLRHNLLRHKRTIHEGKRPFKCNVSGCNASFVQRFDLQTHAASVHDKRKDFCCRVCSRAFSQRSNLLTHLRAAHDDVVDIDSDNLELVTSSPSSHPPLSHPPAHANGVSTTASSSTSSSRHPRVYFDNRVTHTVASNVPPDVVSAHFHSGAPDQPAAQYRASPSVADESTSA